MKQLLKIISITIIFNLVTCGRNVRIPPENTPITNDAEGRYTCPQDIQKAITFNQPITVEYDEIVRPDHVDQFSDPIVTNRKDGINYQDNMNVRTPVMLRFSYKINWEEIRNRKLFLHVVQQNHTQGGMYYLQKSLEITNRKTKDINDSAEVFLGKWNYTQNQPQTYQQVVDICKSIPDCNNQHNFQIYITINNVQHVKPVNEVQLGSPTEGVCAERNLTFRRSAYR